jgi:hypothetical protein
MVGPRNSKSQPDQNAQRQNGQVQKGQDGQGGGQQADSRTGESGDATRRGDNRTGQSGDIRYGGGGADGTVWDNINTGNNRYATPTSQPLAPTDASGNPADTERNYRQSLRALQQLRHMVQNDPQAAKEVADLARQMQRLDPSRFPGNPAMVEHMQRDLLSSIDRLELQLQRDANSSQARTGKSDAVPSGYQESVAEYYRRLSKNP